jgi:opacity protein-like surface antigen
VKNFLFILLLNLISLTVFADESKWNSYYLGGSLGYADGRARNNEIDIYNGMDIGKYSTNGMQYGIYGGRNWSMNQKIVLGVDLGFGNFNIKNSRQLDYWKDLGADGDSVATTTNGLFIEAAGRLGFKILEEKAMVYLKAGYIQTDVKQKFEDTCNTGSCGGWLTSSNGERQNGPLLGVGVEYNLRENVNIRLDYTHYNFGNVTQTSYESAAVLADKRFSHNLNMDTLRIGAAYNF